MSPNRITRGARLAFLVAQSWNVRSMKSTYVITAALVLCAIGAAAFILLARGSALQGGQGRIVRLSDCRTSLALTTSCQVDDRSWQECRYHFRAEGVPDRGICSAFLRSSAGASGVVPPGRCREESPSGWRPVSCTAYHVESSMRCFLCAESASVEVSRQVLQAFDPSCTRAVVMKSCNEPLR